MDYVIRFLKAFKLWWMGDSGVVFSSSTMDCSALEMDFGDIRLSMLVNCVMGSMCVGAAVIANWKDAANSARISLENKPDIRSFLGALASTIQHVPGRIKHSTTRLEVDNGTCVLVWDNVCTTNEAWVTQAQRLLEIVKHIDEDWTQHNCKRCGVFFPPPFRHTPDHGHCDICTFMRKRCAKVIGGIVKEALANPYHNLGRRRLEREWKTMCIIECFL